MKRVDSARRIGSVIRQTLPVITSILYHPTTSILYPTLSDLSPSIKSLRLRASSSGRSPLSSRHRRAMFMSCLALSTYVSVLSIPLLPSSSKSLDVIISHSFVSPHVFPWTVSDPSKSFRRSPRVVNASLTVVVSQSSRQSSQPRIKSVNQSLPPSASPRPVINSTAYAQTPLSPTHRLPAAAIKAIKAINQRSASQKTTLPMLPVTPALFVISCPRSPPPHFSRSFLAITTASLLFLAIGAASPCMPAAGLSCTSPNAWPHLLT